MATILCDISALQFYRTPPWVVGSSSPPKNASETGNALFPSVSRQNATEASIALSSHLHTALAGVSEPFHIIDSSGRFIRTKHITCHRTKTPSKHEIVPLGNGLYVTSPARTILDLAHRYGSVASAKIICEFCGLYTLANETDRLKDALDHTPQPKPQKYQQLTAYYNQNGAPVAFGEQENAGAFWEPCIRRDAKKSGLWKRPPLCTIDELVSYENTVDGVYGIRAFRRALLLAFPGSGSPAETIAGLLIGPKRGLGQEGLPPFLMNRRIYLDELACLALGQRSCVLDISWPDGPSILKGCCVEIDGAAFHDDSLIDPNKLRDTNRDSARRAALAHMGVEVVTLSWSQLADLEQWDIAMDLVYQKLDMRRPAPSAAFLEKRNTLRKDALAQDIGSLKPCAEAAKLPTITS